MYEYPLDLLHHQLRLVAFSPFFFLQFSIRQVISSTATMRSFFTTAVLAALGFGSYLLLNGVYPLS
jgi:hypothetical protein